jgi:hypothetical protein
METTVPRNPKKRARHEIANDESNFQVDQFEHQQRLTRDQHRRIDEIAQQLAFLDRHETVVLNKVRKNARQLPEYPVIQHRRNLTLEEHRRVIWLRFGSLDSMDKPWHSSKEVFLRTGVRPSTQYNIIKRWLLHGKRIITMVSMRGPNKMLSYAHRVFIANPRTLMEMRHLSLIQRAEALKQRLGL